MKLAALFALFGSAAAFAPASQQSRVSSTALASWREIGVTPPVGFFDPFGLSANKSEETMFYYRESEVKHGRVAMAACLGWYLNAGGIHPAFNSELSNDPLEAASQLAPVAWVQFVVGCGAIEYLTAKIKERPGAKPGDLLGSSYWVDETDAGWVDFQNRELTNGRLAMLAFMGILTQDLQQGNYGDMIFHK